MTKVVIFDWGGIVESHENDMQDLKAAKIRLIKRYNNNISEKDILEKWPEKTSKGLSVGAISKIEDITEWYNLIQKNMNINVPFMEFKKSYEEEYSKVKYYKDVVTYVHSLKNKCTTAILSNLTYFDKKRINDQYDLSQFTKIYLSFEIGMRKPDGEIYEYVLKDLDVNPKDILFIDDNTDNILTAQECGWNTCQAYGYELDKIKHCVDNFLNLK